MGNKEETKALAQNRQAAHDYEIIDTYECGIVLTGTEIKSVRKSHIQLKDGFARVREGEIFLANIFIAQFEQGNINNHEETRSRKLLLHKSQIRKIDQALKDTGMTFIPLRVYLKNGVAKVLMGLARGKHRYDKRESLKKKDLARDLQRQLRNYR